VSAITIRLDADQPPSGFPYSTLDTPFRAEKPQETQETMPARGTGALGRDCQKK